MPPQLWVIAGPNGAGKSTLVEAHRLSRRIPIVNPDVIAKAIAPDEADTPAKMLRAGRIASAERRRLILDAVSFGFETTLTGQSELRVMEDAKAAGYKITLVYVGLGSELISLMRVRSRVLLGGHDVPEDAILRRYAKSVANLPAAMHLADRSFILDNSRGRHRLLMVAEDNRIRRIAVEIPAWAAPFIVG